MLNFFVEAFEITTNKFCNGTEKPFVEHYRLNTTKNDIFYTL